VLGLGLVLLHRLVLPAAIISRRTRAEFRLLRMNKVNRLIPVIYRATVK